MDTEKKKRGRPPKRKVMEFEGMTYEGAINHALDQEVKAELDDSRDSRKAVSGERHSRYAYRTAEACCFQV